MKNTIKSWLRPSKTKTIIISSLAGIGLVIHYIFMFFSLYRIQAPVLIDFRPPVVSRFVSPVSEDHTVTPLQQEPKSDVISPTATPTPTPKEKAQGFDLVGDVEAAEIGYPYEDEVYLMDDKQKTVMAHVEARLGKAYAELIFRESGFHNESVNSIGACGLPQALPCEKMACELTDVDCQLDWIESYVEGRYGTIDQALSFHDRKNWY